jgi:hypothetical protein
VNFCTENTAWVDDGIGNIGNPYVSRKYKMHIDVDGNPYIRNTLEPADVHINNDRPFTSVNTIYTFTSVEVGGTIRRPSAIANTVRIPNHAPNTGAGYTISFPIGGVVKVVQTGTGAVTIDGEANVVINGVLGGSVVLSGGGYAGNNPLYVLITKVAQDEWEVLQ